MRDTPRVPSDQPRPSPEHLPVSLLQGWEVDEDYSIGDFLQYDLAAVVLDLTFFFFAGRMHETAGIDVAYPWALGISLGGVYPSLTNYLAFLEHSVSLYEIRCNWPLLLFVYVGALVALASIFAVKLVRSHRRRGVLLPRAVEAVAIAGVFLAPVASSDSFHLHHWFGMWILGMVSNAPETWCRLWQAYCLGAYVNGIAVYGRDFVLGCQYSFYQSTNQGCSYMECYVGENETEYRPFVERDWRTCNEDEVTEPFNTNNNG